MPTYSDFFFFQAEDGIRDRNVTGVQTCALPICERGQAGIDELQKQTVGLLSLKPLSKDVYDAQVSFNLLAQYGSESRHSLEEIELKIDRHLATLLAGAGALSMPSLRLIQAPVFHGYSMSVWTEFEENPGPNAIVEAL